jgi:hypothetical protein
MRRCATCALSIKISNNSKKMRNNPPIGGHNKEGQTTLNFFAARAGIKIRSKERPLWIQHMQAGVDVVTILIVLIIVALLITRRRSNIKTIPKMTAFWSHRDIIRQGKGR